MNAVSANTLTSPSSAAMPEAERNVLLLTSLRGLVRGLSALFWGLPVALICAFQTALGRGEWMKPLGFAPITCSMLLLFYGTFLLGRFQTQERIWMNALERARLLALANVGLSPFVFFWSKVPGNVFFLVSMELVCLTMLVYLFLLNSVLARLAAMLPDETLRGETKLFTRLNQAILLVIIPALPFYFVLSRMETLPRLVVELVLLLERFAERGGEILRLAVVMLFIVLPVAMTMALLWKMKEVIMASVFSNFGHHQSSACRD